MKKEFLLLAVLAASISTISEPKSAIARTPLTMRLQHAEGTVDLQKVNLIGSNLQQANLSGADLRQANLNGAKMPNGSIYRP